VKNYKIKKSIDFTLLCWLKWAKRKEELEKSSPYLREMLSYYS
jgi:hypothetical protein